MNVGVWLGFVLAILVLLALDLGVLNRRAHVISIPEALGWTAFWVALALAFTGFVYAGYEQRWFGLGSDGMTGRQAALEFFTAYVVEKSLSIDNVFVIAMIMAYFGIPAQLQHRVLFWGIFGALVLRGLMIAAGLAIIRSLSWAVYGFGALLLYTAAKMLAVRHDNIDPERNTAVRLARRWFPVTEGFHGERFLVRNGRTALTPLALALVLIESSDVLFAIDSIPAVLAVTQDPFLVYTSNVFAILGLRSLYFALAAMMSRFRYLKMSLVFLLAFVGIKMMIAHHFPIPTAVSLVMISGILSVGVLASLLERAPDTAALESPLGDELGELAALTYRNVRRLFALVAGSTLLVIGTALLVLPGIGTITILVGLVLLSTEFVWARIWLDRARRHADGMRDRVSGWITRR